MPDFPSPPNQDPLSTSGSGGVASPPNIPAPPSDFALDSPNPFPNTIPDPTPIPTAPPPVESFVQPAVSTPETPPISTMPTPESFAPPPPIEPTPQSTAASAPKKSPFRFIVPFAFIVLVLGAVAFVVVKFILPSLSPANTDKSSNSPISSGKQTTITYYGLWEPPEVMRVVLDEFEKQNPDIKVDYQLQQPTDYRERLQTLLAQKTTPDVIRFHSTWIPMLLGGLAPAPETILSPTEISSNFYQAVTDSVVISNQVYAVPTTLDGLGLYVNQKMLDTAQIQVPTTWEDLRSAAKKLTQYDPNTKQISQAGVAMGTTANVDHWPDIVSLMIAQNGVKLSDLTPDNRASEALRYYTLFLKTDNVWSENLPSSVQAFAAGKVAMILAPSWQALTIQTLNPSLSWKIYPVPQLPDSPPVTWVNFWVEGVPKNSNNPEAAWKLVKFLSTSQAQQQLFETATKQRGFGQAPANKALASTTANNPIVGPFVSQASTATTFYTTSFTHDGDTGINSRLIKYLGDAVNSYQKGTNETEIVPTLQQGFYQVLSQFRVIAPTPAPAQ